MASRAVDRTLADFIAGALSPPLIMALVGSLVFFLHEIAYEGLYRGTLQWVLFFFVFGAVLIARMSMLGDLSGKSGMYGLVLGGLVWLALQRYVDYSENPALADRSGFINLSLIALIWWSAHRLTLDCTFLDEETKGQGRGLLDAAGLERSDKDEETSVQEATQALPRAREEGASAPASKKSRKSKKKSAEEQPGLAGWWARFLRYREKSKKRPKTLGVWVVFFSLAALPLFGLGQAQIPPSQAARRTYAFSLLLIYVGSGLGLLVTTSFLSLRMYLRERGVVMPASITLGWLLLGGLLIVAHLFVSSLLPRPADPQPLWDWTGLTGASARDPSRWSPMKEKNDPSRLPEGERGQSVPDAENEGDGDGGGDGQESGKSSRGQKGDKKGDNKDDQGRQQGGPKNEGDKHADGGNHPAQAPPLIAPVNTALTPLLEFARWIVIALVVLIVVIVVGRAVLQFLANFTFWAGKWLAFFDNLGGGGGPAKDAETEQEKRPTPRPFSSYPNPFENGRAKQMSAAELVRYSFAALQAWGRENDLARGDGETPMEFAARVGLRYVNLGEECRKLTLLYARLAYSTETLSEVKISKLREFWTMMCNVLDKAHAIDYEAPIKRGG